MSFNPPRAPAPPATAGCRWPALLVAAAVLGLAACAGEGPTTIPPPHEIDPALDPAPDPSVGASHRLMIGLEMVHFEHPAVLDTLTRGFDAFLYGHLGAYEDRVASLEARGLESCRYFNVFSTDPLYPTWGGFFSKLHTFLTARAGWIRGVGFPYYSNPEDPDRIIDHTRGEVSAGVARIVNTWASLIGADQVFLDLTFDTLSDWMIRPGEQWPWPPEQHSHYATLWAANMQSLINQIGARHHVMINGSTRLAARAVLYESQVWNHRRGFSPWSDLIRRALAGETIPALHVGHHHLRPAEYRQAEGMVLAAWLLADQSYLLVEPEGRPLAWAREITAAGLTRFAADGPAAETATGVFRRRGRIGDERWVVEVDPARETGRVYPDLGP